MAAGKARVHELAKELGVTSKEVLARLSEQGEFVKSASSTVEAPVARRLRESFGGSKPAPAKGTAKSPGKGPDKSLDKALDAAIDMAAGNGKATAAPAKAADSGGAAIVSPTTPAAPPVRRRVVEHHSRRRRPRLSAHRMAAAEMNNANPDGCGDSVQLVAQPRIGQHRQHARAHRVATRRATRA